jgi:hypothetical protein
MGVTGVITRIGFVTWADALPDIGHLDAAVFRLVYLIFCRGGRVAIPACSEKRSQRPGNPGTRV